MVVLTLKCLGSVMALMCHLEICQKYALVRVICHLG